MNDSEKLLKEMGQRIVELRKQKGLTQDALSEMVSVTSQMISYAELGKKAIRPENLYKLSKALGVSSDYLLTGEIIDKDYLVLQDKLQGLPPDKIKYIENIIDLCIGLTICKE